MTCVTVYVVEYLDLTFSKQIIELSLIRNSVFRIQMISQQMAIGLIFIPGM